MCRKFVRLTKNCKKIYNMDPLFRLCWKLQVGAAHSEALWSFVQSRLVGPDAEAAGKSLGTEAKSSMEATVQRRLQKCPQDVGADTI